LPSPQTGWQRRFLRFRRPAGDSRGGWQISGEDRHGAGSPWILWKEEIGRIVAKVGEMQQGGNSQQGGGRPNMPGMPQQQGGAPQGGGQQPQGFPPQPFPPHLAQQQGMHPAAHPGMMQMPPGMMQQGGGGGMPPGMLPFPPSLGHMRQPPPQNFPVIFEFLPGVASLMEDLDSKCAQPRGLIRTCSRKSTRTHLSSTHSLREWFVAARNRFQSSSPRYKFHKALAAACQRACTLCYNLQPVAADSSNRHRKHVPDAPVLLLSPLSLACREGIGHSEGRPALCWDDAIIRPIW